MAYDMGIMVLSDAVIQLHARWLIGAVCYSKRTRRRVRVDSVGRDYEWVAEKTHK